MAAQRKSSRRSQRESLDGTELLVLELQEIHSAENQLSRVLPRIAKAANSDSLRQMLEERLTEGEKILKDVDTALEELEQSPGRKKNVAAEGLINDMREHVQEIEAGAALDTVLIGAVQKTEHYCIAAWGTARALAQATGQKTAAKAMERAIKEGKDVDQKLTELAENEVTPALLSQASEEDEEQEEETGARSRSRKDGGATLRQ
jgi:ferritin-like metal-binding protein YciE